MKKVVVVPYDIYSTMNDKVPSTLDDPTKTKIKDLEDDMRNVLNDISMPIDKKRVMYQQLLQNLLNTLEQFTSNSKTEHGLPLNVEGTKDGMISPLEVSKPPHAASELDGSHYDSLKSALPIGNRAAGISIYNSLKKVQGLEWGSEGNVVIDGVSMPQTNILDLVIDLSRRWKRPPPKGWSMLLHKLANSNFPKTLIVNNKRRDELVTYPTRTARTTSDAFQTASVEPIDTPRTGRGLTPKPRAAPYPRSTAEQRRKDRKRLIKHWLSY